MTWKKVHKMRYRRNRESLTRCLPRIGFKILRQEMEDLIQILMSSATLHKQKLYTKFKRLMSNYVMRGDADVR